MVLMQILLLETCSRVIINNIYPYGDSTLFAFTNISRNQAMPQFIFFLFYYKSINIQLMHMVYNIIDHVHIYTDM